eukprot:765885-Amorphochlora_amoeboformis.AAC.1
MPHDDLADDVARAESLRQEVKKAGSKPCSGAGSSDDGGDLEVDGSSTGPIDELEVMTNSSLSKELLK